MISLGSVKVRGHRKVYTIKLHFDMQCFQIGSSTHYGLAYTIAQNYMLAFATPGFDYVRRRVIRGMYEPVGDARS